MTRAFLLLLTLASAQAQTTPHIGYVYPAGGRQGDTFEVTVGGQYLDGVKTSLISGPGVHATLAEYVKPITKGEFNKLRDQLQELMDKKKAANTTWTAADDQKVADLREKIANFIRRPMTPALAETARLQITLDPDAGPGERQLRLVTPTGISNPIVFCIGQLPEISRTAARVVPGPPKNAKAAAQQRVQRQTPAAPEATDITLPVMINGQIAPGGLDRYKFTAAKGQHLVVAANVRELIPYISDAVPGWFQAAVAVRDAAGKEVAYADHFGFHQDPVTHFDVPADGSYTLEIHDSLYRGREDFVYRIAVGELPYITSIFPLGAKAGVRTPVELKGWNLPTTHITLGEKGKPAGIQTVSLTQGGLTSNTLPFATDTLPEIVSHGPNTAQRVKLPIIINGRIAKPGDQDVFRFDAKAGDEIVAEVVARRLDSPLDSILKLTDAKGKQIAMNDDFDDRGAALITHQADSLIQIKLPASGTYFLSIADVQHKGGPDFAYRLRISHPQPDYQIRMTPASVSGRGGLSVPITIFAIRKDGFKGEIDLKLKDAPAGFILSGGWIPAGQTSVRMTLTLPARKIENPVDLHLEGISRIDGKETGRAGIPAEDMMQAFFYHHIVPEDRWLVRVGPPARARGVWKLLTDQPVEVPLDGDSQPVKVFLPLGNVAADVKLLLNDPPEGITIDKVSVTETGVNLYLRASPKVKPGTAGNLIVDAFIENENLLNVSAKKRRTALGLLPAIPFQVPM